MTGLLLKTAMPLLLGGLAFGQCSAAPSADAAAGGGTVSVSDARSLNARLAGARGGETILVAPGDYGEIWIRNRNYPKPVTIKAAQPGTDLGRLRIAGSSNIGFSGLTFHLDLAPEEKRSLPAILIQDSSGISFHRVHIHGSLDGDPGNDGYGMRVIGSQDISLTGSRMEQLGKGAVFIKTSGIEVSNNDIHDIRSDGLDFAQASSVVIDGNRFRDFYPVKGDHADGIQFLTKGMNAPSTDIRITNNVLMQGKGLGMQGIFIKDETKVLPYRDVLIANNLVYINTYNGIAVANGRDVKVTGNTVLSEPGDKFRLRIVFWDVEGAELTDNVADIYLPFESANIAMNGNLILDDSPGEARRIPNLAAGPASTLADLVIPGRGFQPAAAVSPKQQ